jgi:hypothetical protein
LNGHKRLQLIGINYKNTADNARRFLGRYGMPIGVVGLDGVGWRLRISDSVVLLVPATTLTASCFRR